MSKNLNEELTRIKTLFNFKMGDNAHDVLSEQVITKSVISEQPNTVSGEVKREQLKPVSFSNAFKDNMVGIDEEDPILTGALHSLEAQVQSKKQEGKKLESISVSVDAGSTPKSATNGLPKDVAPDHDYGLGYTKVCEDGKKDKCWLPYSRRTERVSIPNGNTYLANQRANNLKVYLEKELTEKYGAKVIVTTNVIDIDSEKYVSAVITGVVMKEREEQLTNFYISAPVKEVEEDKFYMGAAPASIWGKKKLNINNDFTLEKAQELAKKNITDKTGRDVRVTENPMLKNTKHPSVWYGKNQAWIEVKDYKSQTANKQQKGVIDYWFENSESWEDEKKNLQKHRSNAATLGGVGTPGREGSTGHYSFTKTKAISPPYVEKRTTEPLINEIPKDPYR